MNPQRATPDLLSLVNLFYETPEQLGEFEEIEPEALSPVYRRLLAHQQHMTVTVESFHRSPVNVQVLQTQVTPTHYARKILLVRQSDRRVVQFGIVRLNFAYLSDPVRQEIERQQQPLGRILIRHNVLRQVQLASLWKLIPGEDLRKLFRLDKPVAAYGRTALIFCDGEPAVELLEIVTPT